MQIVVCTVNIEYIGSSDPIIDLILEETMFGLQCELLAADQSPTND